MLRSRLSLLSLALLALAVLSPAAPAAAEQLAYQCGSDICLIDPDSPAGGGKDITNTATGSEWYPKWSPLGNAIAYMGLYPGDNTWELYSIDPAESDPSATNISQTPDRDENSEFDWSADGTRIAFGSHNLASDNPLQGEASVARADGASQPVAIGSSPANEGAPHFSPDGNTVVFARESSILMAPADGTGTPTPISAAGVDWSPDGRYLAGFRFGAYPYGLLISNVDGSGWHELEKPIDGGTRIDWSCDSTRITYVADEQPNLDQVWVAPTDGSGTGVQIPMPPGWIVPHNPVFSPDGTRIAFDARPNSGPGYEQLLVAPADGSAAAVPITETESSNERPSWKPGPACAGSVPPPVSPGGSGGSGSSSGSSNGTGPGGGNLPATQTPVKLKLALFKQPVIYNHFMTIAGIDCHAQGGHPTGKVAEICAAAANAYPTAVAPQTAFRLEKPKASKPLFAKGAVKVPAGKKKLLKLKITAAGMKLLKPGKTLKLKVAIVTRQGTAKPVKMTKTVKVKVPK